MSHEGHNDKDNKDNSSEDIEFDFSTFKKFFSSKTFQIILLTLLIIIPVILTVYIRMQAQYMPTTDAWAQNSVNNYYKNNIAQQVNAQYPNLPATQKQKLIDEQFSQFEKTNKDQLDQQIQQTSEYFKTGFQYQENNHTYTFLGDLDSYFYLRYARNIDENGYVCDEIIDNKCIDTHMVAPIGTETSPTMHPLGIVYTHKILHFFNKDVNLMQAAFILPTILAVIAAIAAFFIGRKLMNDVAGFFASMFVALSPLFITRTLGSDTDVWNVMFPLLIILTFLYAFETKSLWKRIVLTGITGLLMGIFSFAWSSGWWYIFDFLIGTLVLYILFELLKGYINYRKKHTSKLITEEVKQTSITFAAVFIFTMIFVSIFVSFSLFAGALKAPLTLASGLKVAAHANLWPNVYTTVAELNEANIPTVVSQTSFGLNILFSVALLGIIFTLVKRKPSFKEYMLIAGSAIIYIYLVSSSAMNMNLYLYMAILMLPVIIGMLMVLFDKESTVDIKMALLLTMWFVGMIFASIKGVRFILLMTPAFGIAAGVAIGYIYQYITRIFSEEFNLNKKISTVIVFLLLCLLLITPITIGVASGKSYMPSMTNGWWDSLTKIREESKPDAIINSWWDFGHWFKYVADRGATLDGAIQNHPNAHWLGKLLQTSNEKETLAILRMLDCGSNNAFDEVNKKYDDTEKSQNVISEIILMSKSDAKDRLVQLGYTDVEVTRILELTHCEPPENYLIASEDMVGKAGVWAHFGLWDFDKAFIINEVKPKSLQEGTRLLIERFNYSEEEASRIYYEVQTLQTDREMNDWISPWPSYATGNMVSCQNVGEMVVCVLNIGIGSNGQQNIIIERAIINITNPQDSVFHLIYQDRTSGGQVGENFLAMKEVVVSDQKLTKYAVKNASISLSILIDITHDNNQTQYRALVSDPLLIDSTFTKLFYLDGKHTEHFEKFSDVTDITGSRIIVWKVKW